MRMHGLRVVVMLAALLAAAGCGRKVDVDSPLAFVPADTPYVFANIEPMPDAMVAQWRQQMQAAWPLMTDAVEHALVEIDKKPDAEGTGRVLHALFDEFRNRSTPEQWQEIGLGPKVRAAIYGVDLLPVVRLELADPDAFRAAIARIEKNAGASLATIHIGDQEVRRFGDASVTGLLAIEGRHLVLAFVAGDADEASKRRVLGLDKPAHSMADSGALAEFNKTRAYLPYGSGWIDTRRVIALAATSPAVAKAVGDAGNLDAGCREELDAVASKMPRFAFGYTELGAERMTMHARVDLAPSIAQALIAVGSSTPGTASPDALIDMAFALPILRTKDFWVAQADAVAKSPFHCALLAPLNDAFVKAKSQLDQTVPPPLADLSGVRMTVSHFAWPQGAVDAQAMPDVSGSVLVGSNNPSFLTNLAQLSVPALRDIKLAADGKPVSIPASVLPGAAAGKLDLNVAMSAKMLGLSVGKDEAVRLGSAVTAAKVTPGVLFEMNLRGEIYALMGDAIGRFADKLPAEQRAQMETQRKLYAMYAQWFKRIDARMTIVPEGIDLIESVEFAKPTASQTISQ
jgi:predicted small lipoprotein YifL